MYLFQRNDDTEASTANKTVAELWFEAQQEMAVNMQPTILRNTTYEMKKLGNRRRAGTTWEDVQNIIDTRTNLTNVTTSQGQESTPKPPPVSLEAADWSDDSDFEPSVDSRSGPRSPRPEIPVEDLWFTAQAELQSGQMPRICRKYGVNLKNMRQHIEKFQRHRASVGHGMDIPAIQVGSYRTGIDADNDESDHEQGGITPRSPTVSDRWD